MNLRNSLNKAPLLKKSLKFAFGGILRRQERSRIERYNEWLRQYDPSEADLAKQKTQAEGFSYKPLISIITPTYNTPEAFFHEMIQSVQDQTYTNWELVIVDDASPDETTRKLIKEYAEQDARIKCLFLEENHHIAGATNEAIKIASGEFISLFDHDDVLRPNALYEIARALNENRDLDFIYTDEDKITDDVNYRRDPFFKSAWNPDFLRSVNYITHLTTIRKSILDRVGYEDASYNGAQDWELFLRTTRNISDKKIYHIPKVLYSWRIHDTSTAKSFSTKPYVVESQQKAIKADLQKREYKNAILKQDAVYPGQWYLSFVPNSRPKVSVVLINGDEAQVAYVKAMTGYDNYDVVYVREPSRVLDDVNGEYVVVINNRLAIGDKAWLTTMLGDAERKDIGFVAARYSKDANVVKNMKMLVNPDAESFLEKASLKDLTKHLYTTTRYNIPVVQEGAVMVEIRKIQEIFPDKNPRFDLEMLSTKLSEAGYRNLYNPYVKVVK